jgi:sensor c-di-GMP phosphodiesterase-like protein
MNKPKILILVGLLALVAIITPIGVAIMQSMDSGEQAEKMYLMGYAKDALKRSEDMGFQSESALLKLAEIKAKNPCSVEMIKAMREIAISSSYLLAVGYVSNDHMRCSSFGGDEFNLYLGPVDLTNERGRKYRSNIKFPFDSKAAYLGVELNGFVTIIDKNLPINITTNDDDLSISTFTLGSNIQATSSGIFKPEWVESLKNNQEIAFLSDDYVVAIVKSKKYLIGSLAALPISHLYERTWSAALILVPVGIIAGLILGFVVYYFSKLQMEMRVALKLGLNRNEFYLMYQPIVDLQTGKWVGVEALMRWKRATGEMVRPDLFISYAEESGLIKLITKRLLELVAKDAKNLFNLYPDFYISINLSADDLHSKEIVKQITSLIDEVNAKPKNIMIEVTERGFLNASIAKEVVDDLRAIGVHVAIDDFGTGYSSLSYLKSFKIDYLKIDKTFVDAFGTDSATSHVISHIIKLAKALSLEVVAEGVEMESQAQLLRELGVQFAQGWLYAKPMEYSELIHTLSS